MASSQPSAGTPESRWRSALEKLYPSNLTSQKKICPCGAFLGLCEEGLIKGIPAGKYTASRENKAYAVRAVALLTEGTQSWSVNSLWKAVSDDSERAHKSQMDVVTALWKTIESKNNTSHSARASLRAFRSQPLPLALIFFSNSNKGTPPEREIYVR